MKIHKYYSNILFEATLKERKLLKNKICFKWYKKYAWSYYKDFNLLILWEKRGSIWSTYELLRTKDYEYYCGENAYEKFAI